MAELQVLEEKLGKGPVQTFIQRRHTDGQQVYEKVLNQMHNEHWLLWLSGVNAGWESKGH